MAPLIAVVDDDLSIRKSLDRLIRSVGMEAILYASAEELLEATDPREADCLILDVRLPGMSGIDLLHHLDGKCNVPVIFITAHGSDEVARAEAASARTVAYLIKPFNADELLDAVNRALKWNPSG